MKESIEQIKGRVKESQKNYGMNLATIEDILKNERGYVSSQPYGEDVVVLYSGGLDSTVMIDMMIKDWNVTVHPLMIKRGAKAEEHEEKAFDFFVDYYKNKYPSNMGKSAKIEYEVPPREFKESFPKEYALTVGHPLRNSTMQNLAVMYAVALNGEGYDVKTIFSGSIADDNTEPELGLLSLRSQTLNTCINTGNWSWQITSPLTDTYLREKMLYKKDLIKYAIDNQIPLEKTRTCFSSEEIADGTCNACKKRLDAFNVAGIVDPVKYVKHKSEIKLPETSNALGGA